MVHFAVHSEPLLVDYAEFVNEKTLPQKSHIVPPFLRATAFRNKNILESVIELRSCKDFRLTYVQNLVIVIV